MNRSLRFEDAYYDGDKYIYFFSYEINGLFRINIDDQRLEFLLSVKEYDANARRLFGGVVCVGNKLIFTPLTAYEIMIYDINDNKYSLCHVRHSSIIEDSTTKFCSIIVVGDVVYMFPAHYPAIIEFNVSKEKIVYHTDWIDGVSTMLRNKQDFFRRSLCISGTTIIAPFCFEDKVLLFDISNERMKIYKVGAGRSENEGFSGICHDGNDYWLSPMRSDSALRWNFESGVVESVVIGNRNDNGLSSYTGCMQWGEKIIILPAWKNDLNVIDPRDCKLTSIDIYSFGGMKRNPGSLIGTSIMCAIIIKDNRLFICTKNGEHYILLNDNGNIDVKSLYINSTKWTEMWQHAIGNKKVSIRLEEDESSLEYFLLTI